MNPLDALILTASYLVIAVVAVLVIWRVRRWRRATSSAPPASTEWPDQMP